MTENGAEAPPDAGVTVIPRPLEAEPERGLGLDRDEEDERLAARSAPRPRADEGEAVLRGDGSAMAAPLVTRLFGRRMESRDEGGEVSESVDMRLPLRVMRVAREWNRGTNMIDFSTFTEISLPK